MSLIIETGANVLGAESYISVADASAYHASRGNSAWAALADDAAREALLRKATDYMQQAYRTRWKGLRASLTQALDWPRYDVQLDDVGYGSIAAYVPSNSVPVEVCNACAELALRAAAGDLAPDVKREVIAKTIGPIRTEWRAGAREFTKFRSVDLLLKPYLAESGLNGRLVRG